MVVNPNWYQELASRTESLPNLAMEDRVVNPRVLRLLHAGIGMGTEAGEFNDMLKKHIYYGAALDELNLVEEMGDLLWYIAIACNTLGVDLSKVMKLNIQKLDVRYPDKFTEEYALMRDLIIERATLEDNSEGNE